MSNDIVKIRLQYNNKTTLVELDAPRSIESIKPFLRVLWEAMEEPPEVTETPPITDFLRSPEVLDGLNEFACPFNCKDHTKCPNLLISGKCTFGRHTAEQVAAAPQCPVAAGKHETNS